MLIGWHHPNFASNTPPGFLGNIEDFRITKGVARYGPGDFDDDIPSKAMCVLNESIREDAPANLTYNPGYDDMYVFITDVDGTTTTTTTTTEEP